ncbi:MAG TPA: hypothetical protein VKZ46_05555, partial [Pedomonas sp.]|nr:hypothetical protein [Pedomonas sp.]
PARFPVVFPALAGGMATACKARPFDLNSGSYRIQGFIGAHPVFPAHGPLNTGKSSSETSLTSLGAGNAARKTNGSAEGQDPLRKKLQKKACKRKPVKESL